MARKPRQDWAEEEKQVLINHYGQWGLKGVCKLLPQRSQSSIRAKISYMQGQGLVPYLIEDVNRRVKRSAKGEKRCIVLSKATLQQLSSLQLPTIFDQGAQNEMPEMPD